MIISDLDNENEIILADNNNSDKYSWNLNLCKQNTVSSHCVFLEY